MAKDKEKLEWYDHAVPSTDLDTTKLEAKYRAASKVASDLREQFVKSVTLDIEKRGDVQEVLRDNPDRELVVSTNFGKLSFAFKKRTKKQAVVCGKIGALVKS